MIKQTVNDLELIIKNYGPQLSSISEADWQQKKTPEKWSKLELLGHLIDSVQNNIRRFIVAQYEVNPKIIYDQDFWVLAANYQHRDYHELILLWQLLNKQALVILKSIPTGMENRECITGAPHSIHFIAADYNKHLLHHLHQLLDLEPLSYP